MIVAGIDCGAKNTKTVIMKDGAIVGKGLAPTGFDLTRAVEGSFNRAMQQAGITRADIRRICGTGSGKNAVKIADECVNEIKAMARGAFYFFPGARTVADVGAEEGRAAKLDHQGNPVDFAINEKCAAGAGAFIEAMARALEVSVEEMGVLCLQSDREIPLNAQCVIFAESEVVGLIHSNTAKADISKAIHDCIAGRIVSIIRRVGLHEDVVLIGGLARGPGFVSAMRRQLKLGRIYTPDDPEFGAAVGAAVLAAAGSGGTDGCGAQGPKPIPADLG
jgi:benzoyl-CoA reductase subunit D